MIVRREWIRLRLRLLHQKLARLCGCSTDSAAPTRFEELPSTYSCPAMRLTLKTAEVTSNGVVVLQFHPHLHRNQL